jgi:hypothetical protein|tara:strand:- start:2978 stop:3694 length:717 start_codon:yes stop_codon:yes gene_type:complete
MGYLDNSTIVVDAVLTKEGRKRLADGNGLGIEFFTLSDSGIDYRLWNPDHPSGSAFYGEAIENLPSLEAIPRAEFYMRNKLITLDKDVTGLPYWSTDKTITPLLINNATDTQTPGTNGNQISDYEGIDVEFTFNQQSPGEVLIIIEDGTALNTILGKSNCTVTDLGGFSDSGELQSYQSLINLGAGSSYYKLSDIVNPPRVTFKRADVNKTTDATIIDLTSGIYKSFQIQTNTVAQGA